MADVWAIALPRLGEIGNRSARATPALLRFLSTTLALRVRWLARKLLHGGTAGPGAKDPASGNVDPLARLPADAVVRVS